MVSSNRLSREAKMKEKADALFLIYQLMGADRSLKKLAELCGTVGVKISEQTIERYSTKYDWQIRLLEAERKLAEKRERDAGKLVDDMNRQDATLAQGMKALVVASLRFYQDKMKREAKIRADRGEPADQMLKMNFHDIVTLALAAQRIERLARGQVISRTEIWVEIAATVVREFVLIFEGVNSIEDENERKHEFLRRGDEMMTRYYSETIKQGVNIEEKYKG